MIPVWVVILSGILGFRSLVQCTPPPLCMGGGGVTSTLSISYTADGTFSVSVNDADASKYCVIQLMSWNSVDVSGRSITYEESCNTISAQTFDKTLPNPDLEDFQFGSVISFKFLLYPDSNKGSLTCASAIYSVTPPLCRGGSYDLTVLNVLKRPYGTISASLSNKPLSGECVYYLTEWNTTSASATSMKSDCSGTSFTEGGFTHERRYTVKMVSFETDAVLESDQPVCGVNAKTIIPLLSSAYLNITDTAYGVVQVQISNAAWGSKCEVSLLKWGGVDKSSLGITKSSADCSAVSFSVYDVGFDFQLGADYSFEMAEYSNTVSNTAVVNPVSSTITTTQTIADDTCASANIVPTRIDDYSVAVSITGGKSYAACRVTVTSYNGSPVSMVRVGLCSSYFRFTSDGTVLFAATTSVHFKYEFFPNGDITSATTCASSPELTTWPTSPATDGTCTQVPRVDASQIGLYVFSIAEPAPMIGTCKLLITSCTDSTQTNQEIAFPSCSSSLALTYANIHTSVTDLIPGRQCNFKWKYYNLASSNTCSYAGSAISANIMIPVTVTQSSPSSTSISVTVSAFPSALTAYLLGKTSTCHAVTSSCSSEIGPPYTDTISCTGESRIRTFTTNNNCVVEVLVYADADSNALASSGTLSFAVAGIPVWGASQKPVVTLYGDSCMAITWSAPSITGGAPILCYEVQRKDASGSYYVIQDCTIGDTSTSTTSCGFTKGVAYQYQVIAINRNGQSADLGSVSISQKYEYLLSAPDSTYSSPASDQKSFVAGAFPAIIVQSFNPASGGAAIDTATSDRLFVSTVVSRCKLDSTATIKVDLTNSDTDYTSAELPISANSPPALTQVFDAVQGSAGMYRMVPASQPLAGAYSVITYSLETGGLGGQYWSNPFYSGNPAFTRKDPVMDFVWGMEPLINSTTLRFYDLVGIRWTGFIEAAYSETYAIFVESNHDQVRVWIDDVVIINKWEPEALCNDVCVGYASLKQSSSSSTGGRKFSSIRAEFVHSKGPAQSKPAQFTLKWTSMSQALEVIPPERLFKSVAIQSSAKTITLIPANIAPTNCTFELENEAFNTDENYNIIVYAKDKYGNILQTSDSQFKASFTRSGGATTHFLSVPVNATANNGTYTIAFRLPSSGDYGVTIKEATSLTTIFGGSFSIVVSTGEAYSISDQALVGGTQYADVPVTFQFYVKDSSGNTISGSGLTTMPPVHVSALWTGDTVTHARLGTFDDVSWRSSRYGILFTDATITYSSGYFRATISLPRQGSYDVTFGVDDGAAAVSLSPVTVVSDLTSLGSYALVIPGNTVFPPNDLAVGVASSFILQLRDQYMNAISEVPSPAPTVVLRLQNHPTANNQVPCTAPGLAGQYTCSITPQKSGSELAFSILVDGVFSSYAYDSSGTILYSRGPWSVDVSPGVVSGTHCVLSGVRTTYVAGVAADATLLLRDEYDNNLGAVSAWPDIVATFTDVGASYSVVMDENTFEYDASAGIVTIPLLATTPDNSVTLTVKVATVTVPLPYGILAGGILVIDGIVNTSTSNCPAITTPAIAGATVSSYCYTKDSQGNAISWSNLNTSLTFVHQTDSNLAQVVALGTVNVDTTKWDYSTTLLTKAGAYWYYILMGQPGGLVAQYYQNSTFASLIGVGGTPLTIVLSGDVSPTQYTRIDQFIDFDLGGPIVVDGVTALSVRWIGRLLSPITGDVVFSVACNGGVRVQVGASVIDYLSASSVDETLTVSTLTSGTYYYLQIDYKPSALASLSFRWTYSGAPISGTPFVVPPSSLHSSLNVATSLKTITINVGPVSIYSSAKFSSGIVAGKADYVIVQATDQYGNDYSGTPSACVGTSAGTVPTCLFRVTMVLVDGSTIDTAVDLTNGKIKIPVTFATDGPKDVNVMLQVNTGVYSHIQGSPYSIVVNPNPR